MVVFSDLFMVVDRKRFRFVFLLCVLLLLLFFIMGVIAIYIYNKNIIDCLFICITELIPHWPIQWLLILDKEVMQLAIYAADTVSQDQLYDIET